MNGHRRHPPFESSPSQSQLCALWLCCAYWAVLSIWCSLTLRPLLSLNFPAAIMYINLWRKCATHLGRSVFNFRRRIEREVSRFSMRSIPQLVTTGHRTFLCARVRDHSRVCVTATFARRSILITAVQDENVRRQTIHHVRKLSGKRRWKVCSVIEQLHLKVSLRCTE